MAEPFVGEIRMFAGNFAPRGWAFCSGQLLAINQNDALFALFGTIYGGDGRTTFGLPDLRSRVPIHHGSGPGLTPRPIGSAGGLETVAVSTAQLPAHNHSANVASGGSDITPVNNYFSTDPGGNSAGYNTAHSGATMATGVIGSAGGGQSHENRQPLLAIQFIVALVGIFPSRN